MGEEVGNGNGKPSRYSFLAELLETTHRNEAHMQRMLEKQEDTTAIMLSLKEHKTIERVDSMWTTMSNIIFAGRIAVKVIAWILGICAAATGSAYALHAVFGWF